MDFVALGRRLFLNNRRRKRRIDCGFAPIDAHGATEIDDFFVLDEYREKSDIWFCVGLHTGDPIAGLSAADRLSQLGYLRSIHHRSRNPGADNLPVVDRRCSKRRSRWRRGRSRKLRTGQDAGTSGSQCGQKNRREALLRASIPALAMKSYYIFDDVIHDRFPILLIRVLIRRARCGGRVLLPRLLLRISIHQRADHALIRHASRLGRALEEIHAAAR
jgi:hypothetical protein